MLKRLLIVGTGGHGKVVLDCAISAKAYDKIVFMDADLDCYKPAGYSVIYEHETTLEHIADNYDEVIVAIGNNDIRLNKTNYYIDNGIKLATLVHPSAVVSDFAQIGAGTVVFANAVANPFAEIGRACIINTGSVIEHDCVISDGVHISPNASIGGTVCIGEKTWVCIGSTIKNNLIIGKNSIIGAGAVVLKDIPDNVLAVGVPAVIKKHIYSQLT